VAVFGYVGVVYELFGAWVLDVVDVGELGVFVYLVFVVGVCVYRVVLVEVVGFDVQYCIG